MEKSHTPKALATHCVELLFEKVLATENKNNPRGPEQVPSKVVESIQVLEAVYSLAVDPREKSCLFSWEVETLYNFALLIFVCLLSPLCHK